MASKVRGCKVEDAENILQKSVRRGKVDKSIPMTGKTVLITGANTGIGFATATDLAKRGARVILACRSMERGKQAEDAIRMESRSENVVFKHLDLGSFASIRQFASDILATESRLDVLINNAGVLSSIQAKTADGYEMHFGVNHLGHFLLTNLLLDLLEKSSPSRVVIVSSLAHHKYFGADIFWNDLNLTSNYGSVLAYAQSKLMNILFSRELSKRLEGTGVATYSLEPGGVKTDLQRNMSVGKSQTCMDCMIAFLTICTRRLWKTPEQGAQTSIYCAVAPELSTISGKYYSGCKEARESSAARNDEFAKRLWDISEQYTGLKG